MKVRFSRFTAIAVLCAASILPVHAATIVEMEVDATDLPRKLLHTRMTFPVEGRTTSFWYPEWIPGIHAPRGPIENMAGLRFRTPGGDSVSWQRDDIELYRFEVNPPSGSRELIAELDYICNQPNSNSGGIDSYGNAFIGSINWNTCVLYPDGVDSDDIQYRLKLRVPAGWKIGTSMKVARQEGDVFSFEPVTLEVLVDSPWIGGPYLRTLEYSPAGFPKVLYHLNSESPAAVQIPDEVNEQFRRLAEQSARLFQTAPFDEYHFLVTASDDFPGMGLEHLSSSLNGVSEDGLTDPKKRRLSLDVLPHEIVHAWCGKFRRPAGMVRSNFHEPKQTKLLWVYEGLTQYLGHLLFVRSGCISSGENIDELAVIIAGLDRQRGRAWRSLEDTARDSWHLRGRSRNWSYLRRNQDYYSEGAVIWMEVDAMIRRGTDGAKSLDDFCRTFFRHAEGDGLVKPFDEPEIYGVLNGLLPHDWAAFFEERVKRPLDSLPLSVVEKLGYRLEYDHEIGALEKLLEEQNNYVRAWSSVGMGVRSTGEVMDVVPGSAADLAGLAPGMEIVGVNDRKFSVRRFREAIADSVTNRGIDLLLLNGDRFQTVRLEYADGQRFLKLVRNPSEPDILGGIFAPLD